MGASSVQGTKKTALPSRCCVRSFHGGGAVVGIRKGRCPRRSPPRRPPLKLLLLLLLLAFTNPLFQSPHDLFGIGTGFGVGTPTFLNQSFDFSIGNTGTIRSPCIQNDLIRKLGLGKDFLGTIP